MPPIDLFRRIPSVSELLESPPLQQLVERVSHSVVVSGARSFLDDMRSEIRDRSEADAVPSVVEIAERIARRILDTDRPTMRPVINATGVLLHTGLGRSPLAEEAVAAVASAARDYTSVELDLLTGRRSKRGSEIEALLRHLTGAEAALVVNNNAAATLLALAGLAAGREVVVSRGQLIEIGGSFRLPDVMAASGATLREVGTTNKTRLSDYESAIGDATAALMRVHPSNFRIVGFTETPTLSQLATVAQQNNLPLIDDVGSGALYDFSRFGFPDEPSVRASIESGADLVLFSGDKLLGGPQCGIVVGRRSLVDRLAKHPLARAFRVGKMTLAALAATLRLYRDEEKALLHVPLLQFLSTPVENLKNRAERLAPQIADEPAVESAEVIEDSATIGGGSLPGETLPTWCIAVTTASRSADQVVKALRTGERSVVARVKNDQVILDLRTVFPRQDIDLVAAVGAIGE